MKHIFSPLLLLFPVFNRVILYRYLWSILPVSSGILAVPDPDPPKLNDTISSIFRSPIMLLGSVSDPDPTSRNSKKNLYLYCFVSSLWLFSVNNDLNVQYLQKVISQINLKKLFLLAFWRSLTKRAGSGSVSQRYGSRGSGFVPKCHESGTASRTLFFLGARRMLMGWRVKWAWDSSSRFSGAPRSPWMETGASGKIIIFWTKWQNSSQCKDLCALIQILRHVFQ